MKKIYVLILIFTSQIGFCMHPLITDDAPTVSFENYEIETSVEGTSFIFSFKQGITNKSELGIELQKVEDSLEKAINFKFNIYKNFSFSFSNNFTDTVFLNFIFTKNFSDLFLHFNLGNKIDTEKNLFTYSVATEYFLKKFAFVGEIVKEENYSWLLGFRYSFFENLFLCFGYRNSFSFKDICLTFGLNYTF
jgi:hypothetical protein